MKKVIKYAAVSMLFTLLICLQAIAQQKPDTTRTPTKPADPAAAANAASKRLTDVMKKLTGRVEKGQIEPYDKVITKDFITMHGMFTVHKSKSKDLWYFEIPDSLINRPLLAETRISKTPGGANVFPGEEQDSRGVQFGFGPDSVIEITQLSTTLLADANSQIAKATANADSKQVLYSFSISAYGPGKKSYVVDATPFLDGSLPAVSFINTIRKQTKLSEIMSGAKDLRVVYAHAYPENVELCIRKSGTPVEKMAQISPEGVTIETVTSFVALPKIPMLPRYTDFRVGYMPSVRYEFTDDQQSIRKQWYANKWRMEPKAEDRQKWARGGLVEPQKPIIIYLDPATPKLWRPYLIAGINDWQKAFEKAGFKNAVIGKEWPENDTTMHMDDARYSFLHYFPSAIANAYGPHTIDPRTGEILQTHIGWYHSVMETLRDWYITQAGATDTAARHARFSEKLMGSLIRFVSSHEVGHTLGLRHNMLTSNFTPVDSMRNQKYLEKHGHTGSIMDYARFNYVAQPEDNIKQEQLWPRIGDYDEWAIEWGYGPVKGTTSRQVQLELARRTTERLKQNPALAWVESELGRLPLMPPWDPRAQSEVLGDDPMKANTYGIKNLQRVTQNLISWAHVEDGDYYDLRAIYSEVQHEYQRFLGHVQDFITGSYLDTKTDDQGGATITPVSKSMQLEALDFFDKQLFTTPIWLMNKDIAEKVSVPGTVNFIEKVQGSTIDNLFTGIALGKIVANENRYGDKVLSAGEYLDRLHRITWREIADGKPVIDSYRRNVQRAYVANLFKLLNSNQESDVETEVAPLIRADARKLQAEMKQAMQSIKDDVTLNHLRDLNARLDAVLNKNKGGKAS